MHRLNHFLLVPPIKAYILGAGCGRRQKYPPMSGRRYEGSRYRMGWSTAWAHVMFDDVVTVSFTSNGHRSREDARQELKTENKKIAIRVRVHVII